MSKTYRKKWFHKGGIIRQRARTYQAEINYNYKRERCSFETRAEAETWLEEKAIEVRNRGSAAFDLDDRQRHDAVRACEVLQGTATLEQAARFWQAHNAPAGGTVLMPTLLQDYLEAKSKLNRRPRTMQELVYKLGRVVKNFQAKHVHNITATDLVRWLDEHTALPSSRNKYRRLLHALFKYAVRRGIIQNNPVINIENASVDEKMPECYSAGEAERLLRGAEAECPNLVPAFAIGLFAGLRPSEVAGLNWSVVDFESRLITVTPETAKRRRMRHVTMSDNLIAWLLPYRKTAGPVSPSEGTVRGSRAKMLKKVKMRWIQDGLRHTFGSMHFAMHQDAPRTAAEMGHLSPTLLFNHYRGLITKADAEEFWALRPTQEGQELTLPVAG